MKLILSLLRFTQNLRFLKKIMVYSSCEAFSCSIHFWSFCKESQCLQYLSSRFLGLLHEGLTHSNSNSTQVAAPIAFVFSRYTVGVDGGDPSTGSKSTRRDRAAGIVAAVANPGFLGSFSSHFIFIIFITSLYRKGTITIDLRLRRVQQ
ncbi:hypothetical protein Y032_0120g917 [Ancylostoma ceylanicum]|uniref:Uncharacterized protein n=1 Tax=Ancylostoma ceylanicum TaxID=53326 RepID=A0A016TAP2_9BILA|nr:hypothetical protein Y032_0120g917 [Ancylostoma ceylanicum]